MTDAVQKFVHFVVCFVVGLHAFAGALGVRALLHDVLEFLESHFGDLLEGDFHDFDEARSLLFDLFELRLPETHNYNYNSKAD